MLAPIYELLFQNEWYSLALAEDRVAISYKTYESDKASDRQAIMDGELAPGKYQQIDFCVQLALKLDSHILLFPNLSLVSISHQTRSPMAV